MDMSVAKLADETPPPWVMAIQTLNMTYMP